MEEKGWIALDIDGTITDDKFSIPIQVVVFFRKLIKEGWRLVFVTGRSFSFSSKVLSFFDFPYFFSMQNGSAVLHMPEKRLVVKRYMDSSVFSQIEKGLEGLEGVLLAYGGYENGDIVFWKTAVLSPRFEEYVAEVMKRENQTWERVSSFRDKLEEVSFIKCVGSFEHMTLLAERLQVDRSIEFSLIRDPFDVRYYMLLITAKGVDKGSSLRNLMRKEGRGGLVIAAGNDDNDFSLLKAADVKIAMSDSPKHLQEIADIIAPPVEEFGIISSLEHVLKKYGH